MGVSNSPDIFLHKMNDLSHEFRFIHLYIDDLLILTKVDCTTNVQELELTLIKWENKNLNVI